MSKLHPLDLAAARRIRTRFAETGDAGYLRDVPGEISESWQRCHTHGVDAGLPRFPLSEENPRWSAEEATLLNVAAPVLEAFRSDIHDSAALLAIISRSGRIVCRDGSRRTLHEADRIGSVPGAITLESLSGTNSAGTGIARRSATTVKQWEHFCEAFWHWSDIAVPVIHPATGEMLGVVDLGFPRDPITPAIMLAAKLIASKLESALLQQDLAAQRAVMKLWEQRCGRNDKAMLALDRHGRLLCASDAALHLLGLERGRPEQAAHPLLAGLPSIWEALQAGTESSHKLQVAGREVSLLLEPARDGADLAGAVLRLSAAQQVPAREAGWKSSYRFSDLVGDSPALKRLLDTAARLARTELPILLSGETGTGKELVAHAIHQASARADGPFVAVNCGAIPQELIAAELFGYEKGAFTGASRSGQKGKFEIAHGGTLFLDEITETSAAFQVSLLRVMQDQAVVPVGADKARPVDVRIISATNREPEAAVAAGILRRDLYYRLNGALLALPPLRSRREDIPLLVAHFCRQAGRPLELSPEALAGLMRYDWPGNLRELQAVIRSATALARGAVLELADLPESLAGNGKTAPSTQSSELNLQQSEIHAIERSMALYKGNVKQAAAALGIGRSSLYRKLKQLRLTRTSSWSQE